MSFHFLASLVRTACLLVGVALLTWGSSSAGADDAQPVSAESYPSAVAQAGQPATGSEAGEPADAAQPAGTPPGSPAEAPLWGLDDERAREHFVAAEAHYAEGRFSDAARGFALAYELSRRPEMLVNLARAHERGGELRAAVADLELLIQLHPTSSHRGEAEETLARLRAALPPAPGPVKTSVSAGDGVHDTATSAAHDDEAGAGSPSWPTLTVAAGALAVAVAAVGTGVRSRIMHNALEDECPGDTCSRAGWQADKDRGQALGRASTGLTFAAVALAGTATVLWLYDSRSQSRSRGVAFGGSFDGLRALARIEGRF